MWRTCWDFRSQFWASSGHSSRLPLKPRFRAIQRYKNYPLRAKIEVQRFSRPFCGSVGAKCASAHMMRSNTKIQINSANSDLILQAHYVITCITVYVGRRRSARSYCVRAHAPGLEQTDDYHRRPCKLCVNWMPEYSDCRSPYSDMHMGPITGLAVPSLD